MNIEQLIPLLKQDAGFMQNVSHWHTIPKKDKQTAPFPAWLDGRIQAVLRTRGIDALYTHQSRALEAARRGQDFVVVTPTASGKTMCYNLPVLNSILHDSSTRALYLFPTKALSQDQAAECYEIISAMGESIKAFTYDGDTAQAARSAIRQAGHIVVTNPDMLHSGILPHHTKWVKLFENLKYIIIDEIHAYRGVFGANLANVLRRLMRLCAFYGSRPQFVLCSATINNPGELAEQIIGRPVTVIDQNGAPHGERHIVFYNPPVVNRPLGIRKNALAETHSLAALMLKNKIPTIVFAKSRVQVEVLTRRLKDMAANALGRADSVHGYRGGYLPSERRAIEKSLRDGSTRMVVSTNALELGVDIGSLSCCILLGYPGTIASTWQQAGRAGRRHGTSLTVLVANSSAINQFLMTNPAYFYEQTPENALINKNNLYVLLNHFKCAAYELPFQAGEPFGDFEDTTSLLAFLEEGGIVHRTGDIYHWSAEDFPAGELSLRTAMTENFLIIDQTNPAKVRVVGEMDRFTVPMLLHENAIYMHEGTQYEVERLDFDAHKAYIKQVNVDYYTDADLNVSISLLDILKQKPAVGHGEVKVTALVKLFKKMKLDTGENLGYGPVRLPEVDMHTTATWWTLDSGEGYPKDDLQTGMLGIRNALSIVLPLYLMCSPQDISVTYQVRSPITHLPTLLMYDAIPGGMGLSEKSYAMDRELLRAAAHLIESCPCEHGCPSCVGAGLEPDRRAKALALNILQDLMTSGKAD